MPFVIFGLLTVSVGVIVYIVLPQALLAENVSLILEIFFLILIGMILGLALLSANLRGFLEIIMTYLLLFWERKSMRALVKKNLKAHKHTNKLTSIIYALTLGCIIFLCVALNLVIRSTQVGDSDSGNLRELKVADIEVYVSPNAFVTMKGFNNNRTDNVLREYD